MLRSSVVAFVFTASLTIRLNFIVQIPFMSRNVHQPLPPHDIQRDAALWASEIAARDLRAARELLALLDLMELMKQGDDYSIKVDF